MTIEDKLRSIPRSYDDFVKYVLSCIKDDNNVEDIVLQQLRDVPESTSSDVLKAIYLYLGVENPIEIVDDETEYKQVV